MIALVGVVSVAAWALWLSHARAVFGAVSDTSHPTEASGPRSLTTPEHLRAAAWWPTRPMETTAGYAGSEACGECHGEIANRQEHSQMAHTLGRAAGAPTLLAHLSAEYRSGPYRYSLKRQGGDVALEVADGPASESAVLRWAFGSGDVGQSYLWQKGGSYQESRFNYFSQLGGLGATPGRLHGSPVSLEMALGRTLEEFEVRSCLSCHTTAMVSAPKLIESTIVPGVTCEACHGPGAAHIAAAEARGPGAPNTLPGKEWDRHILNPAKLTPVEAVDLCGSCHSTPADVALMGAAGPQTVRFPAYRLERSKCWGVQGDAKLTCFGCHDPHAALARESVAYDGTCLSCHALKNEPHATAARPVAATMTTDSPAAAKPSPAGKACPVAVRQCTSCHMPKVEVLEMHYKFTDHMIRIAARDHGAFPD